MDAVRALAVCLIQILFSRGIIWIHYLQAAFVDGPFESLSPSSAQRRFMRLMGSNNTNWLLNFLPLVRSLGEYEINGESADESGSCLALRKTHVNILNESLLTSMGYLRVKMCVGGLRLWESQIEILDTVPIGSAPRGDVMRTVTLKGLVDWIAAVHSDNFGLDLRRGPANGSNAHRFIRDAFLGARTDPVSGVGCLVVDVRDEFGIAPVVSLDVATRRSIYNTATAVTTFFALAEAFLTAQRTGRFADMLTTILMPTIASATSRHVDPSLVGFAYANFGRHSDVLKLEYITRLHEDGTAPLWKI